MTEIQAHEFLSKCESRLLWRKVGDENKVIEILTRNFRSAFAVGFFWLGLVAWNYSNSNKEPFDCFFAIVLSIIALMQIGFAIWLLFRLRQVRLTLGAEI